MRCYNVPNSERVTFTSVLNDVSATSWIHGFRSPCTVSRTASEFSRELFTPKGASFPVNTRRWSEC